MLKYTYLIYQPIKNFIVNGTRIATSIRSEFQKIIDKQNDKFTKV